MLREVWRILWQQWSRCRRCRLSPKEFGDVQFHAMTFVRGSSDNLRYGRKLSISSRDFFKCEGPYKKSMARPEKSRGCGNCYMRAAGGLRSVTGSGALLRPPLRDASLFTSFNFNV